VKATSQAAAQTDGMIIFLGFLQQQQQQQKHFVSFCPTRDPFIFAVSTPQLWCPPSPNALLFLVSDRQKSKIQSRKEKQ